MDDRIDSDNITLVLWIPSMPHLSWVQFDNPRPIDI